MTDTQLKERVKKFLAAEKITNSEFGKITGTSASYVTSIKTSMSFDMVAKLLKINPRLNLEWLIVGTPPMYSNDNTELKTAQKEIADLRKEISYLQKIVALYEGNTNGTTTPDQKSN